MSVTDAGRQLAARLPWEHAHGRVAQTVHARWADIDALVLFLATGAATRIVAPLLRDKRADPAVVCVDEAARFAVALTGGHEGGANLLAHRVAAILGAEQEDGRCPGTQPERGLSLHRDGARDHRANRGYVKTPAHAHDRDRGAYHHQPEQPYAYSIRSVVRCVYGHAPLSTANGRQPRDSTNVATLRGTLKRGPARRRWARAPGARTTVRGVAPRGP